MSPQIHASQPFVPVITGGDLGAYTLAREFHEAYGVISAVVPTADKLVVGGSKITQVFPAGPMFEASSVLEHLADIAQTLHQHTTRPLLLMAGYDHLVRIMVDYATELRRLGYVFPEFTTQQIYQATLKEHSCALCEYLDINFPQTSSSDCARGSSGIDEFVASLTGSGWHYPLIL